MRSWTFDRRNQQNLIIAAGEVPPVVHSEYQCYYQHKPWRKGTLMAYS